MKNKNTAILLRTGFIALIATSAMPVMAADTDKDSCWSGRHANGSCLEHSTYEKNGATYIVLSNVCSDRLYVKWCADKRCGAEGLGGGQTKKAYEYVTNATVRVMATGVIRPQYDWVCAGKVSGWRDW